MTLYAYPEPFGKRSPQQTLKESNARKILTSVQRGQTSRAELSKEYELSPTTVSALTDDLLRAELLTEVGEAAQTRAGRRPTLLEIKASGGNLGVVLIRARECVLTLCDLRGRILAGAKQPLDPIRPFSEQLSGLLEQVRVRKLRGVCLIPVDRMRAEDGGITGTEGSLWASDALREACDHLRVPLLLADAAVLAASALGEAGLKLLYLRFDESIRVGFVSDGKTWEQSGRPMEAAHLCVDPNGPLCTCGGRGCLQTCWSREALLEKAGAPDWRTLCAAYQDYEPTARAAMNAAAAPLAIALGNLCCLFPANRAVLDGLEGLGEGFLFTLRKQLTALGARRLPEPFELRYAPIGQDLTLLGAVQVLVRDAIRLPE